jgi:molybdopterin converting factor small subunit
MKVLVKSFASVTTTGRITESTLDLSEPATAVDVMRSLGIPADAEMIVLINQRPSLPESPLADGDRVTLMPPVSAA